MSAIFLMSHSFRSAWEYIITVIFFAYEVVNPMLMTSTFIYKIQTGFTQKIQISTITRVSYHQHTSAKCDMQAFAEAAASDASSAAVNKGFYRARRGTRRRHGKWHRSHGVYKINGMEHDLVRHLKVLILCITQKKKSVTHIDMHLYIYKKHIHKRK